MANGGKKIVYDGAAFCADCEKCPQALFDPKTGMVIVSDPAKPERGSFEMTVAEYNTWLRHGSPIPQEV